MPMNRLPYWVGVMSGTSCDGIDVAVIKLEDNTSTPQLIAFQQHDMPRELHEPILRLAAPGLNEIDTMGHLDRAIGIAFANAIAATLEESAIATSAVAAIGSHGQTIRHRPQRHFGSLPFTLQIGCADTIVDLTGITTVSDFRRRDIAAGGEGAPLVPFAHQRLFSEPGKNIAIINIGGIANITWLGTNGSVIGFDSGPGNMVMDGLMLELTDGRHSYDHHGEMAAHGQVNKELLTELNTHPFLSRQPPKSTGREEFGEAVIQQILSWPGVDHASMLTTACEWTAGSIAKALNYLPASPDLCLICGGGSYNPFLMQRLQHLIPAQVQSTDQAGIAANAVEAISFALLAHATIQGKANSLARVTGASYDNCGGKISPGSNWLPLMQSLLNQSGQPAG